MKLQNVLDAQYELDQKASGVFQKHLAGTKLVRQTKLLLQAYYDFSKQGGAVGTMNLLDCNGHPASLPMGAVITDTIIDVIVAPTSGGSATVALSSGVTAADLKAATAIASLPVGLAAGTQIGTLATYLKLTADSSYMQMTIGTAPLTAGKMIFAVEFYVSA